MDPIQLGIDQSLEGPYPVRTPCVLRRSRCIHHCRSKVGPAPEPQNEGSRSVYKGSGV